MVDAIFYICAAAAIAGALGVIASRSPIGSVLSLLGTFFALAVIYLLAGFQFLAAVQILVYGGAIMVLFLFVIMLLNLGQPEEVAAAEPLFKPGLATTLFLGGWSVPFLPEAHWLLGLAAFMAKTACFLFLYLWVRWTLPRLRFDQLMGLGWKVMLPLALLNLFITGAVLSLSGA